MAACFRQNWNRICLPPRPLPGAWIIATWTNLSCTGSTPPCPPSPRKLDGKCTTLGPCVNST